MRAQTTGSFAVHSIASGEDLTPRARKARALLAYLVSDAGTKMPKDRLVGLLWGDRGEAQARSSLRQALLELRRAVNGTNPFVCSDREHIWVAAGSFVEEPANVQAEPKDAFEDLDNITPEFDEWLAGERCRRGAARVAALKAEAQQMLAGGLAAESTRVIDQFQTLDPSNEDALRLGMEAEFRCGRPAEIAKRYGAMEAVLQKELGVQPSTETRALRDSLLTQLTAVDCASGTRFGALYEAAELALNMGAWECDLITEKLSWTAGTFRLFGVPFGSTVTRQEVLDQYEAGSREHLDRVRSAAIRAGTGFSIEVDVITRQGIKNRLRISAAVESREGAALKIFGTKQLVS